MQKTKEDPTNGPKPETFDFLGFPTFGAKPGRAVDHSAADHAETVYARTQSDRPVVSRNLHEPMREQVEQLGRKLKGN